MMLLLAPAHPAAPPPPWLLLLVPVVFLVVTWFTNRLMGIYGMYEDWPADVGDTITENVGWQQVEFGTFRGHCPMSIKFGQRCLHLKQPFPFQPFFWLGPASIPWGGVLLVKAPSESWWAFLSAAEFTLGKGGRMIRLRGKAARVLMAELQRRSGGHPHGPIPPVVGPGAIRPQ